jgi:hypothetical protein
MELDSKVSTHTVMSRMMMVDRKEDEKEGRTLKERARSFATAAFCHFAYVPHYARVRECVSWFILDAFVDLFITICILLNTLFLALDHHNMDRVTSEVLATGNYIFTTIFTAECILKVIALSPHVYFQNNWNIFDVVIVFISLAELTLSSKKMSVLRTFRLVIISTFVFFL